MDNTILFPFNDNAGAIEVVRLCDECTPGDVYEFDWVEAFFIRGQERYLILNNIGLFNALDDLRSFLCAVLKQELPYQSDGTSIGLAWNNYLHASVLCDKALEKAEVNSSVITMSWPGDGLNVWGTPRDYELWMYNQGADIIVEITPVYGFHFMSKRSKGYYPYEVFVKQYKPILRHELTQAQATDWLVHIDMLLKKMSLYQNKNKEQCLPGE